MSTPHEDRLLITLCIAFALEMCWLSEAEFHKQVEQFGAEGMRRALQLALDAASRQTALSEVIRLVERARAAWRN